MFFCDIYITCLNLPCMLMEPFMHLHMRIKLIDKDALCSEISSYLSEVATLESYFHWSVAVK